MGVSKNRGTPKWMVYNGKPYLNGWFGGTTIFGNIHIFFPYVWDEKNEPSNSVVPRWWFKATFFHRSPNWSHDSPLKRSRFHHPKKGHDLNHLVGGLLLQHCLQILVESFKIHLTRTYGWGKTNHALKLVEAVKNISYPFVAKVSKITFDL